MLVRFLCTIACDAGIPRLSLLLDSYYVLNQMQMQILKLSLHCRRFNQNHLKSDAGRIGWMRQVEALTDLYDYSLLLECTENYACEVNQEMMPHKIAASNHFGNYSIQNLIISDFEKYSSIRALKFKLSNLFGFDAILTINNTQFLKLLSIFMYCLIVLKFVFLYCKSVNI